MEPCDRQPDAHAGAIARVWRVSHWEHLYDVALGLVCALLLSLWTGLSHAAVAFDDASTLNMDVDFQASFSHVATGTDLLAILCIGYQDGESTLITVTLGGVNMTLVGTQGTLAMYARVGPPPGSLAVYVEWSAYVNNAVLGLSTFTGVHQGTPLGTFASAQVDDTGPATVSVPSAAGELVVDCVHGNDVMTIAVVTGQTPLWEEDPGDIVPAGSSTKAGAAPNVTMSWTLSQQTNWKIGGVSIKPTAAVTGGSMGRRRFP